MDHSAKEFLPMSRFPPDAFLQEVDTMKAIVGRALNEQPPPAVEDLQASTRLVSDATVDFHQQKTLLRHACQSEESSSLTFATHSLLDVSSPLSSLPPSPSISRQKASLLGEYGPDAQEDFSFNQPSWEHSTFESDDRDAAMSAITQELHSDTPSHSTQSFGSSEVGELDFHSIWQQGLPFVVTGLLPKFELGWTPEYFIEKFGGQKCTIVECQSEATKETTVGEYFRMFGQYSGRTGVWKLKVGHLIV